MLTKWELGQDLIQINDLVFEIAREFTDCGHPELAIQLDLVRARVGDLFNENNDHSFGIFDSASLVALVKRARESDG